MPRQITASRFATSTRKLEDPATLLGIAGEFGVTAISHLEDLDSPAFVSEVKTEDRKAASAGIRGGLKSRFKGTFLVLTTGLESSTAAKLPVMRRNGQFSGVLKIARSPAHLSRESQKALTRHRFAVTRWRSGWDSN